MSALTGVDRALGPDGVRRYRTRWKVLVKSHQYAGTTNLSDSLINVSMTKNIKTVGNASLALTADRNLLNLVYPNDYISIYCDRADGYGWTRVFFGFVDHLEELQRVDPATGKPTTMYTLQCSDFQKAFERTEIYFNPHLAGRPDFDGDFNSTPNIGGAALRTRGVRVNGGPADLVTNLTLLLLGFGAQFTLPSSYNPRLRDRIRQQRAEQVLGRLSQDVRSEVMDQGGYAAFLENIRNRLGISASTGALVDPESNTAEDVSRADRARFSEAVIQALSPGSGTSRESTTSARERGAEAYNILNTTVQGFPASLLDIMDISTFVERDAIDGYTNQLSVWDRQGSVMSFLRSVSNEIVDELFLDLRAISVDGGLTGGTSFSTDLDDLEGNAPDSNGGQRGILYQPALVMREYPHSTIEYIDADNVPLTVRQRGTTGSPAAPDTSLTFEGQVLPVLPEVIGLLWFGAIFSNRPNTPGRHVITIPGINTEDLSLGVATTAAPKHLDTVVVNDAEIISTRLSRSDTDHFNLFELTSDGMLGESARFFMMDLLPIITPTHIVRHGLRTRRLTTRFARNSLETANRIAPQDSPPPAAQDSPPPAAPAPTPSAATFLPVALVTAGDRYTQGYVTPENQWWYRRKTFDGIRHVNNLSSNPVPASGTRYWRYHNGVDIAAPRGTPVVAVRDGKVVMAAPVGTNGRNGYGNIVMIYHEADDIYSLYAHMDSIASNLLTASRSRRLATFTSERVIRGGQYVEADVRAGDQIGTVGATDCEGVHLHFEFGVVRNGRVYPSASDRVALIPDVFRDAATASPGFRVSTGQPTNPSESETISQDPVRVFRERFGGTILPVGENAADAVLPVDDPPEAATFPGDEAEIPNAPEVPVAPTEESTEEDEGESTDRNYTPVSVDTPGTRRLLARWALLNDHWYQHNLEYLSGSIEMRGAPEIRVGYRLDLPDRNLSFYVEGVTHNWSYGQPMTTTLHVTRGQPNNPSPIYVLPFLETFGSTSTQRVTGSRLSSFFIVPDPLSVRRALKLQRRATDDPTPQFQGVASRASPDINEVDSPGDSGTVAARYNEVIVEASYGEGDFDLEAAIAASQDLQDLREAGFGLRGAGSSLATGGANPMASSSASDLNVEELAATVARLRG